MLASEKLRLELAAIGSLPREELVKRWVKAYGHPPPKGVKRALLERAAAWHLQAKHLGGLTAPKRRLLRTFSAKQGRTGRPQAEPLGTAAGQIANSRALEGRGTLKGVSPAAPKTPPAAGTRLLREWNGRMHVVEVVQDGFLFDGKSYRSLTAVARRITGTHRSGPGFFGL